MLERREWTREDLTALQQAAETLERLGVWSVFVRSATKERSEIYVSSSDLITVRRLTGVPTEKPKYEGGYWKVTTRIGDAAVYALMSTEELPLVGWRYKGRQPAVELLEEVPLDVQPHAS
ncbi:hypothetical protein [Symbiobacterium terraclitae]|uniref:hypothetical protein n=1 Tax=Symbiobacterium terraclitae TaxID=557451 RepID=UPI0035B50B92